MTTHQGSKSAGIKLTKSFVPLSPTTKLSGTTLVNSTMNNNATMSGPNNHQPSINFGNNLTQTTFQTPGGAMSNINMSYNSPGLANTTTFNPGANISTSHFNILTNTVPPPTPKEIIESLRSQITTAVEENKILNQENLRLTSECNRRDNELSRYVH